MSLIEGLAIVLAAGLFTALVCGLGTLPFFFTDELSDRLTVAMWGFAGGIMLAASLFGFIEEGLAEGTPAQVTAGLVVGVLMVIVADRIIAGHEFEPGHLAADEFRKLVLIIGVLTVHSFPEGVALGVSFADVGLEGDLEMLGIAIPTLAIIITAAIAVQNIPEGLAVAIPLHTYGFAKWKMFAWAVISSLPQPLGAAIAYVFVTIAREFLPFGFGLAAGAMIFLVFHDLLPEGLERGEDLPGGGWYQLLLGLGIGVAMMLPLLFLTE